MNDDRRVLDLLSDVLTTPPRLAPDGLLSAVIEDVRVTAQRGHRIRTVLSPPRRRPTATWRLAVAAVLVCTMTAVAAVGLTPLSGIILPTPSESPAPAPSATATPTPVRTPLPATAIEGLAELRAGVTYTSTSFLPRMTFEVNARYADGTGGDWCTPVPTTPRTMRFHHPKVCSDNLLIIRPASVDCGTPDGHPDADTLAAAIMANPRMTRAVDAGPLDRPGAVPTGMFAETYHGRALQVNARLSPSVDGPACRLLDDSGEHVLLDITGDLSERLIFVDVHGELVVFRALGETGGWSHLLTINHDIRFD